MTLEINLYCLEFSFRSFTIRTRLVSLCDSIHSSVYLTYSKSFEIELEDLIIPDKTRGEIRPTPKLEQNVVI